MPKFVTLGMFIVDEFHYLDENGQPTGRTQESQIGGGGTYAAVGARIWLPPDEIGTVVDRGCDFPREIQNQLEAFGKDMWHFRDAPERTTTRAANIYRGKLRDFEYLTPRVRITPTDLRGTKLEKPTTLHFICSPERANVIISEVHETADWKPITIYEPIPYRCVPEQLPALKRVLPHIDILSPNADEALSILAMPQPPAQSSIEEACRKLLELGVGPEGKGHVVIRSGNLGCCVAGRDEPLRWVDAFWTEKDSENVVDVTGAGNSFLGGFSAGILKTGNVYEAALYATISASFIIEQAGLPSLDKPAPDGSEKWNNDYPHRRLEVLRARGSIL